MDAFCKFASATVCSSLSSSLLGKVVINRKTVAPISGRALQMNSLMRAIVWPVLIRRTSLSESEEEKQMLESD